jgi:hypothetical protein
MARKNHLLLRLRQSPLDSRDWRKVAASRKSLHVRIHYLREQGYRIDAELIDSAGTDAPTVRYVLKGGPG